MNPRFPVYVISKGRSGNCLTARALQKRNIPFRLVVEPQERDLYAKIVDDGSLLVLPFSNLGQGSIPARNWVWEHSISEGHSRHWILDDNLPYFFRMHQNKKWRTTSGSSFYVIEEFVERYENVALAGMQYDFFLPRLMKVPPVVFNTRIYSIILLTNDIPFRWRGRYNEDTDLSLRVLKAHYCTVLFNAFFAKKVQTMTMKGGNTDELYQGDGRRKMAESLQEQHPDVVKIAWKWGRWQHQVNYVPFKRNKLKLRSDIEISSEPNNFDLQLNGSH